MQAEREATMKSMMLSSTPGSISGSSKTQILEREAVMVTRLPCVVKCSPASTAQFLHQRPPGNAQLMSKASTDPSARGSTETEKRQFPARGIEAAGEFGSAYKSDGAEGAGQQGFLPCTLANGQRLYLYKRQHPGPGTTSSVHLTGTGSTGDGAQLLSKSMQELQQEVNVLQRNAILRAQTADTAVAHEATETNANKEKNTDSAQAVSTAVGGGGELWVDKYSPKSFSQVCNKYSLLSRR